MTFAVGDKVESTKPLGVYGISRQIQQGTVLKVDENYVYVSFDNKRTQSLAGYSNSGGWYHRTWRVIDDSKSFIPEDWS